MNAAHQPPSATLDGSKGRLWSWVENTLLNVLAAGGVVCVALVVCTVVFDLSLIMFKTGSMQPTIPQGSVAVVQRIPADEIRVGDIVTVDRPGELPVTHRVIAVHPQTAGEALVEMRGDANPNPDPGPYRVTEVRKVLWSYPGLARVIVHLSNPVVLGTLTIAMSLLILWAFWPRRDEMDPNQTAPAVGEHEHPSIDTGRTTEGRTTGDD